MKKFVSVLSLFLLSSNFAFAGGDTLLLSKHYDAPDTAEGGNTIIRDCEFYDHQVVIKESIEDGPFQERIVSHPYSEATLRGYINTAAAEPLETQPWGPCDTGNLLIKAFRTSGSSFILRDVDDCTETQRVREGSASERLRDIVNEFCPGTPDV